MRPDQLSDRTAAFLAAPVHRPVPHDLPTLSPKRMPWCANWPLEPKLLQALLPRRQVLHAGREVSR